MKNLRFPLEFYTRSVNKYSKGDSETMSPELKQGAKDWLGLDLNKPENLAVLAKDLTKIRD